MHLAVLMTNTDESAFAQAHPKDAEKFTSMIHTVRPDWQVTSFAVKDGVFPEGLQGFDGLMITGSPASLLQPAPWMDQLAQVIRTAHQARMAMFGACFGHQAIAQALGGRVAKNPHGWAFGCIEMAQTAPMPWFDGPEALLQYGAHVDHVTALPDGARQVFASDHCQNAGFVLGDHIYTTQNHPEMTHGFMAALVEEYAANLGPDVANQARASMTQQADTLAFAQSIARFFEHASRTGQSR